MGRVWFAVDVDDIKYVINFDYPNSSEDYVHRIGRTARASKRGTSYTFFTISNARQAKDLIAVLQEANQQINPKLMQLQGLASQFGGRCNLLFLLLLPMTGFLQHNLQYCLYFATHGPTGCKNESTFCFQSVCRTRQPNLPLVYCVYSVL